MFIKRRRGPENRAVHQIQSWQLQPCNRLGSIRSVLSWLNSAARGRKSHRSLTSLSEEVQQTDLGWRLKGSEKRCYLPGLTRTNAYLGANRGVKTSANFTQCGWGNCSLLPLGGVTPSASTAEQQGRRHTHVLEGGVDLSEEWSVLSTGLRNQSTWTCSLRSAQDTGVNQRKAESDFSALKALWEKLFTRPCTLHVTVDMRRQKVDFSFLHLPHQITIQ